jgi:hypothetical protein
MSEVSLERSRTLPHPFLAFFDLRSPASASLTLYRHPSTPILTLSPTAKNWNHDSFAAVRFRPRVLRDVTQADLSTTMLGQPTSLPIFVAPAAMGRLAHPEGEKCLARIAGEQGIPYIVSANSSVSFNDIAALNNPQNPQTLFYQLYVNKDRSKTEAQLRRVAAAGYKAICVTVDAPVAGKRERDERSKMDAESVSYLLSFQHRPPLTPLVRRPPMTPCATPSSPSLVPTSLKHHRKVSHRILEGELFLIPTRRTPTYLSNSPSLSLFPHRSRSSRRCGRRLARFRHVQLRRPSAQLG